MIDHLSETDLPHVAALLRPGGHAPDADAYGLVYRAEGVPRGCLLWVIERRSQSGARRLAVLRDVSVAASWRRRGIGRRLLAAFERDIAAAGCGGWCTPAGAPTPAMRALMRRAGAEGAEGALVKRFEWAACGVRCRPR